MMILYLPKIVTFPLLEILKATVFLAGLDNL